MQYEDILTFCRYLLSKSLRKDVYFLWRPLLSDAKDDMVLEAAVAGRAKVKELAKQDGVSINQFLASAAAEKVSCILTVAYLDEEARKASKEEFDRVLSKTPDAPPDPIDAF